MLKLNERMLKKAPSALPEHIICDLTDQMPTVLRWIKRSTFKYRKEFTVIWHSFASPNTQLRKLFTVFEAFSKWKRGREGRRKTKRIRCWINSLRIIFRASDVIMNYQNSHLSSLTVLPSLRDARGLQLRYFEILAIGRLYTWWAEQLISHRLGRTLVGRKT